MAEAIIASSRTTPAENATGTVCNVGRFITLEEGLQIVDIAATWEGTPYASIGGASVKGKGADCSGSTNKIYIEAGFPYPYKRTGDFAGYVATSGRFREISADVSSMQAGDVLLWPGHMAIYAPFPEGHPKRNTGVVRAGRPAVNDFYTAFNDRTGKPYAPYNIATFRPDRYRVFRYLLLPGEPKC